jgi:hypothetical protein
VKGRISILKVCASEETVIAFEIVPLQMKFLESVRNVAVLSVNGGHDGYCQRCGCGDENDSFPIHHVELSSLYALIMCVRILDPASNSDSTPNSFGA